LIAIALKKTRRPACSKWKLRHYLTFEFAGTDEKFVYVVTEDVKNSVQEELLGRNWEIYGPVIEFEESSGRKIAVNAGYVRRCQALFEAGMFSPTDGDQSEPDMIIVIEGVSKPLYYHDIDPDDAALVASVMAAPDSGAYNFVSFTDEDGEANLIPADKIMLLESIHYENEFEDEVPEEDKGE
jgi:hypothetical protein